MEYKYIFSAGMIGSIKLKNRLIMPAMVTLFGNDDGTVSNRMIDYYVERARGGVAAIIVESTAVREDGKRFKNNICIYDDKFIEGLKRLAKQVKNEGARIFLQLIHGGRECSSKITGHEIVAPNVLPSIYRGIQKGIEIPRELSQREIGELVNDFTKAAKRAKNAGFDGIELHGAHGYLISQFLSSYSNRRNDQYGKDIFGRAKFAADIVKKIKEELGAYPIIFRMNGEDGVPGGNTLKDATIIAKELERAGVDALHISSGFHESRPYRIVPDMAAPKMCYVHLSKSISQNVQIPVITVGRITRPEEAEKVLKKRMANFVALGRALIADPEFPLKALNQEDDNIISCVGCNQGCIDRCHKILPISCMQNFAVGKENEAKLTMAKNIKNVAVIGGGPTGMLVAHIAASKGHRVDLYEKENVFGGQLNAAKNPPTRSGISKIINNLEKKIKASNIGINLGVEVDRVMISKFQYDILIFATGAKPMKPSFPVSGNNVYYAEEVLRGKKLNIDGSVAVLGGGMVGCETADFLIEKGFTVSLFEMEEQICYDTGNANRVYLTERFEKMKVSLHIKTKVKKVENGTIFCEKNGQVEPYGKFAAIILAVGYASNNALVKNIKQNKIKYFQVGDCRKVTNALACMEDAFRLALSL